MSEAIAIFNLDSNDIKIQCTKEEKFEEICQRFANKIGKDKNSYIYLYAGNQLNFELSYKEHLIDKNIKEIKILVYKKEDYEYTCTNCGEKMKVNRDKIDDIIITNNKIKDKIKGIEFMIDNMIKMSLVNTMNIQLNNINVILNTINEDIKKNNEKLDNLFDDNIIQDNNQKENMIKGIIDIAQNDINKDIVLFNTDIKNKIDVYINNEKINIIKDKNKWKYKFQNEGKNTFKIIFNRNITSIRGFFELCSNISSLDFSNFNTSSIADMEYMFNGCSKLKEIKGLNKFNTNKVKSMKSMFQKCNELEYLDLSNFNTSNVTDMENMFNECNKLKEIKGLNKFNTNKVVNMQAMFQKCIELKYLDLTNLFHRFANSKNFIFLSIYNSNI